jgi:hypothetical protein
VLGANIAHARRLGQGLKFSLQKFGVCPIWYECIVYSGAGDELGGICTMQAVQEDR